MNILDDQGITEGRKKNSKGIKSKPLFDGLLEKSLTDL